LYPFSSPISFVYFDLDDTLLDHRGAEKKALKVMFDSVPELQLFEDAEHLQSIYHGINTRVWVQYSDAIINKDTARVLRFKNLLIEVGVDDSELSDHLGQRYLDEYANFWSWIADARDVFVRVAECVPVGILTNGFAEVQRQKIAQFPELGKLSCSTVISEDTGFMKPDPRIFDHATRLAGVEADQILYVGDSLRSDVQGGQQAGWNVAWLVHNPEPENADLAEATFSTWSQFDQEILPHLAPVR
jgi:HAD superfamily hydrolase (TIGR01549 family)